MKKLFFTLFMACFTIAVYSQPKETTITGNIKSLDVGAKVTLLNAGFNDSGNRSVAETEATDGKFVFTFPLDEPRFLTVEAGPQFGNYDVVVAPGDNLVLTGDSFRRVESSGSQTMAEYLDIIVRPRQEYYAGVRQLPEEERPAAFQRYLKDVRERIAHYSNTIWAPIMIYNFSGNISPSEAAYDALSDEIKKSGFGRGLRAHLNTLLTGKPAPAIEASDRDGNVYTLASLMKGKKYLIVDFWASWCAPCRKGIPEMKEFAKKYADEGLVIVNISVDSDRDAWLKALDEEQMPWANLHDRDGSIKRAYRVGGIPSVFLINEKGEVVFEKLYGDRIRQELEREFGY